MQEEWFQVGPWATSLLTSQERDINAVALETGWTGQDVNNVLYTTDRGDNPTWSLWQKVPEETQDWSIWSNIGSRGLKACYILTDKELLAAYEGVQAALEVIGTEAQLFLAPWLLVLHWMFKGRVPSSHHAADGGTVMMESELVSTCNNPRPHAIFPALKNCYERWGLGSWIEWILWTSFIRMAYRLREWYLCMHIHQKMEKVMGYLEVWDLAWYKWYGIRVGYSSGVTWDRDNFVCQCNAGILDSVWE